MEPSFVAAVIEEDGHTYRVVLAKQGDGIYREVSVIELSDADRQALNSSKCRDILPPEYYI